MNKNTLIGLGLIGVILAVFTYYNQPTEEELKKHREQQELAALQNAEKQIADSLAKVVQVKADTTVATNDSTALNVKQNDSSVVASSLPKKTVEKSYILENDKLKLVLSTKGGGIKSAFLKRYQTYFDFIDNLNTDSVAPLHLFKENKATNGVLLTLDGKKINTRDISFQMVNQTADKIVFQADFGNGQSIQQIYKVKQGKYDIDYQIKFNGLQKVNPDDVLIDWELAMLSTERLISQERMYSTVFYQTADGEYEYLSETSDEEFVVENDIDWVAFKQSYFSSIMIPSKEFEKENTILTINTISEKKDDSTLIKDYASIMNPDLGNTNNGTIDIMWYFGPNDYDLLATYNNGTEDLLNYGWGLFRWLNVYIVQPIFEWLTNNGLNIGLSILLLTIIIKIFLTPIQWKMYVSSAKMKILKPEIDEINQKYPDKENAMAKQSETMALYRESGASPLSGCLPMLIQMPILFAMFRFFPSSFALRQQGFLWAEDLSTYDSIMELSFTIPFYGSHVSLFTLLMAGTTLIYTVINSSNQMQPSQPGMPNLKVIMYIFPIMMIFFFNKFSSGLSFYYFVSTLMSILTMIAIKKFFVDENKLKAKMAAKKAENQKDGKRKGKSKFQQRLEEMQKQQQEKLKNKKK